MSGKLTLFIAVSGLWLLGCQSKPVLPVSNPNITVSLVQSAVQDEDAFIGKDITWGGLILETKNMKDRSELTIMSKKLKTSTRPIASDRSQGRFIARVNGFLDPALYAKGREISIHGTIKSREIRKVDDYNYTYPVVDVTAYHLWPEPVRYRDDYDDFWYPPWYYPYPYHHYHRHLIIERKP